MDNNPIENLMKTTMENIKGMIDVNTIVGEPIKNTDGSLILPISKVSFGFASGGSEFKDSVSSSPDKNYPFGGGSGAGVSLKPIAFLVIKEDSSVRLLPLNAENTYEKIVDLVPQVLEMIRNFSCKSKKGNKEENEKEKMASEKKPDIEVTKED